MSQKFVYNPNMADPNMPKVPLAIVTFNIAGTREIELQKCIASVAIDLPDGAIHFVIPVKTIAHYVHQRQQALRLGEFVAFVDDDDTVMNQSISLCFKAIQSGNYGVAFTDEALTNEDGSMIRIKSGTRTYEDTSKYIGNIHHLAMLNTSCIKEDLNAIRGRVQGVDWYIMKSAINGSVDGAVHVPVTGYNWTQHPNSLSHTMKGLTVPILKLNKTGEIPVYKG